MTMLSSKKTVDLLRHLLSGSQGIVSSAGSQIATVLVTSGLGFFYWWVAARRFPPAAVGLAAATISAMMFLGTMCMLGLGTLLIREFPRSPGKEGSLMSTALIASGLVGGVIGFLFAACAPTFAPEFSPLASDNLSLSLFALGVSLTATTMVLDQALLGLRAGFQLVRNTIFAIAKLVVLVFAGAWFSAELGLTIYATWLAGIVFSLFITGLMVLRRKSQIGWYKPKWELLRGLGPAALAHHALNLAVMAPGLLLPLIVTVRLSPELNASFYVAWMIAGVAFAAPVALATALYANGAREPEALARRTRLTLFLSAALALAANSFILLFADIMLKFFGPSYADQAGWTLRILGLGILPLIIKDHFMTLSRIRGQLLRTTLFIVVGDLLELTLATIGAGFGGLTGLSLGWVAGAMIEAFLMSRTVFRTALGLKMERWRPFSETGAAITVDSDGDVRFG